MHYWMVIPLLLIAFFAMVSAYALLVYTRHKKKETEIRTLKEDFRKGAQKICEAAQKGDSDATLKLEALKESLTEQSVRLTGHKKPPSTVILPPGTING